MVAALLVASAIESAWALTLPMASLGLGGELLHFAGDHSEALAGIAGAGGLDGGVEGEQLGLAGDRADQHHDISDFAAGR
jgi:hypothetical protein